ncbi:hypothetical protein [Mesorhizobium sp. ES1-3]|uniref:hypothetical protein n=1 Tax=Mesorhizobium sp. ES1-3 TaxID=2876628 RepID=UPI001CCEB22A|nr:hypothetical protein [Mesorhizobium sp. ES1-3]
MSVSEVARSAGIHVSQLSRWRARTCAIGWMRVHRNWSQSRSFLRLPCRPPLRRAMQR